MIFVGVILLYIYSVQLCIKLEQAAFIITTNYFLSFSSSSSSSSYSYSYYWIQSSTMSVDFLTNHNDYCDGGNIDIGGNISSSSGGGDRSGSCRGMIGEGGGEASLSSSSDNSSGSGSGSLSSSSSGGSGSGSGSGDSPTVGLRYYVYMAIKKNKNTPTDENSLKDEHVQLLRNMIKRLVVEQPKKKEESDKTTTTTQRRRRNTGGDRVILKVSSTPFTDIQHLNQDSMIDIESEDLKTTAMYLKNLINSIPETYSESRAMSSSRPPKKSKRQRTKSCDYRMVLLVGTFNNRESAERFHRLWDFKSRGPIPRAAWGEKIAKHFKLNIYGDLGEIFNCEDSVWKAVYFNGEWIAVKDW